jgi:hypothetical protein
MEVSSNHLRASSLEDLAAREEWLDLGGALLFAMGNPKLYGLKSGREVLAKVAALRSQKPDSLTKVMIASMLIRDRFPEVFEDRETNVRMNDVIRLRAFLRRCKDTADTITAGALQTIRDRLAFREFLDALEKSEKRGSEDAGYKNPSQAALDFRKRAAEAIMEDIEDRLPGFRFSSGRELLPPSDLAVTLSDGTVIAVDCKPARRTIHDKQIYELLGLCALRAGSVRENWLVLEGSWRASRPRIMELLKLLKISNISIGEVRAGDRKPLLEWWTQGTAEGRAAFTGSPQARTAAANCR